MGLTYHFSFAAPAAMPPDSLAIFLRNVEGDARLMGFHPTIVVEGPFDTVERRSFARRIGRGLTIEHDHLRGVKLAEQLVWSQGDGFCRVAPEHGVVLVLTDARGVESVFGFFRFPSVLTDVDGRSVLPVPRGGEWIFTNHIKSPDQRYRSIVRRFADAGYVESELDEFHAESAL